MSLSSVMARINPVLVLLSMLWACACLAVQIDNWRFPYYRAAVYLEPKGPSPSGMFWDDIGPLSCFNPSLWPDTGKSRSNHLTIEPSVAWTAKTSETAFIDTQGGINHYVNDRKSAALSQQLGSFAGGQALCDVRYKNFLIREVLDVDSRNKDDIDFRGKTDRFAAGRIAEAYCQVDWKYGFFRFGRLNRNWGPFPDRSLLLSSNPLSFDALEFQIASSLFEFRHIFAAFPFRASSIDAEGNCLNRYLTAHSLNLMLGRFGEIGIVESMLFSRQSGMPDLQLINPFSLYTVINTNSEGIGNLMLGAQWNIHPWISNVSLKGQVLIDDFQVDNEKPMDQEPTHWGADIGAYISDFLPLLCNRSNRHVLSLEYRRLSRWLYTVCPQDVIDGQRYTYLGRSLGAESNDNDRLTLSFFIAGKNYWTATAGVGFSRQGENSLWSRWKNTSKDSLIAPNALGYRTEPKFPSGIVERTVHGYITVMGYFKNYADVSLNLDNRWIKNKNNRTTASYVYDPIVSLTVSLHYSSFFISLPR